MCLTSIVYLVISVPSKLNPEYVLKTVNSYLEMEISTSQNRPIVNNRQIFGFAMYLFKSI